MSPDGSSPGAVRIKPAGLADCEVLGCLHSACFPEDPWSGAAIGRLLATPGMFSFLADVGEPGEPRPVGFVLARVAAGEGEIITIGIEPAARRAGAGGALLDAAAGAARDCGAESLFLEVAEDNNPALRLYRRRKFLEIGRRPNYYRRIDGAVAAIVMKLELFQLNTNHS
ncbi:GNAT family N-acetyltransferase [Skermanella pratensis]|uniref:GNAT family N-acetyltransferase n=1 Tax=Skermanella pratensis TaxID=2233999 RepID=UPI001787A687|nr:GNAT family N-acetyltransferase [Skermanella pratensis]